MNKSEYAEKIRKAVIATKKEGKKVGKKELNEISEGILAMDKLGVFNMPNWAKGMGK